LTTDLAKLSYHHITLLTGTPIQNNVEELWTLLNILNSKQFNSFFDFSEEFGELKDSTKVEKLQKLLRPYLVYK
jgi:chromodomain-helicase-DNA-binding protein 7